MTRWADKLGYLAGGLFMVAAAGMFLSGDTRMGVIYIALGVVFLAVGATMAKRKNDDAR